MVILNFKIENTYICTKKYFKNLYSVITEFLLGNDLLVAPVLEEGVTMRKIYLPKGNWAYRGNLNDLYSGPAFYEYPVDIYTLPYFTLVE